MPECPDWWTIEVTWHDDPERVYMALWLWTYKGFEPAVDPTQPQVMT